MKSIRKALVLLLSLVMAMTMTIGAFADDSAAAPNYEIDEYAWFTPEEARQAVKPGTLAGFFLNRYLEEG